jgi:hypothetical protein
MAQLELYLGQHFVRVSSARLAPNGPLRAARDLSGPGLLGIDVRRAIHAGEQFGGKLSPLSKREAERFIEKVPRLVAHVREHIA